MNIESLHVENFKSIREVDVEFSDLNVFVGRNAAGKSNLFEVFQFLRDARGEGIEDAVQMQGGVEYIRNKNISENKNLYIEVDVEPHPDYLDLFSNENRQAIDNRSICIGMKFNTKSFSIKTNKFFNSNKSGESSSVKKYAIRSFYKNDNIETVNSNDIDGSLDDLGSILSRAPQLGVTFDINPRKIATNNRLAGRASLQPDGSNLALVLKKLFEDEKQKQKFLNLASDVLSFLSDTKVEAMPDQSLFLEILEEFEPGQDQYIPAEMLSDGTLHVLALIYILYFSDYEKIFIEEPGRNIHPSLIANLMLKVKDAAENTDKQIFLTTHNVEVLRHTPPEDVRLVSRDDDGFTQVERPAESERVQKFIENDLGMVDLYTENMLGE